MKKYLLSFLILAGFLGSTSNVSSQECVDPALIDPDIMCPALWDPVCGCNGVTYSNSCEATYWGGVTSFTAGECQGGCMDLGGLDFGDCDMALGYALLNGTCESLSGCGYIIDNIDYSPNFYSSVEECISLCGGGSGCMDLAGIDFGLCQMFLGIAYINGECVSVSGCGYIVGNTDYSPYFYEYIDYCIAECGNVVGCVDPSLIDPDAICPLIWDPVCGCDGITYGNECQAINYGGVTSYTPGECSKQQPQCLDLSGLDFGPCDMFLGYALIGETCQGLSGCGTTIGGIDYSPYFFVNDTDCNSQCDGVVFDCINPDQIDENYACIEIFSPVCGCDNITYENSCNAFYYGGVTEWIDGPCVNSVDELERNGFAIFPNPFNEQIQVLSTSNADVVCELYDALGKLISSHKLLGHNLTITTGELPTGLYHIRILEKNELIGSRKLIK